MKLDNIQKIFHCLIHRTLLLYSFTLEYQSEIGEFHFELDVQIKNERLNNSMKAIKIDESKSPFSLWSSKNYQGYFPTYFLVK